VPHGAAKFSVCHALQSDLRLTRDRTLNGGVLNEAQVRIGDLAPFVMRTSVFESGRPKQAANMVSAKGWKVTVQIFSPGKSNGNPV
jgi:hypothetical protein